jgi:hypothetical protein
MQPRPRFWRWISVFATLGLAVPAGLLLWWHVSPYGAGEEEMLWPSSLMFLGLEGPTPEPTSTIVFVYALAFVENCILYAVIGALLWPIAYVIVQLRNRHHKSANSSTQLSTPASASALQSPAHDG